MPGMRVFQRWLVFVAKHLVWQIIAVVGAIAYVLASNALPAAGRQLLAGIVLSLIVVSMVYGAIQSLKKYRSRVAGYPPASPADARPSPEPADANDGLLRLPVRNYLTAPMTIFIEPCCDQYEVPAGGEATVTLRAGHPHSIDVHPDNWISIWNEGPDLARVDVFDTHQFSGPQVSND